MRAHPGLGGLTASQSALGLSLPAAPELFERAQRRLFLTCAHTLEICCNSFSCVLERASELLVRRGLCTESL